MIPSPVHLAAGYELGKAYDEAFDAHARPRAHYVNLLRGLGGTDLPALADGMQREVAERGVRFVTASGDDPLEVDPIPRILPSEEWDPLEAGLAQRARALNAFLADAYGERRIVDAGVVPAHLIDGSEYHEPEMVGASVAGSSWAGIAGLDVVRDARGHFAVLEDNVRTPNGLAYATAVREIRDAHAPEPPRERVSLERAHELLGEALHAAAPDEAAGDPFVVLLSDGASNSAWFEQERFARQLGLPVVGLGDLTLRAGRLHARIGDASPRAVDVVYRRTDESRLRGADGEPTGVAMLLEPLRSGRLGCVNAFGAGLADDKLVHAYVEAMVRFYLHEEPLLPSVPAYDLTREDVRADVLDRLDELVVKPRSEAGGLGVVIGPRANREDREEVGRRIRREPDNLIAQELVLLSTHPTLVAGRLEARHVDLRPFTFVCSPDRTRVARGGLTRVALDPGALVVNLTQDGGAKDTWVLR